MNDYVFVEGTNTQVPVHVEVVADKCNDKTHAVASIKHGCIEADKSGTAECHVEHLDDTLYLDVILTNSVRVHVVIKPDKLTDLECYINAAHKEEAK